MTLTELLQTRIAQNLEAALIIITIVSVFLRQRAKRKKTAVHVPSAKWTISQRYMYLNALIQTCATLEELHAAQKLVKGFAKETFSEVPTLKERHRYTSRLLESYYNKEISLSQIPAKVELCTN